MEKNDGVLLQFAIHFSSEEEAKAFKEKSTEEQEKIASNWVEVSKDVFAPKEQAEEVKKHYRKQKSTDKKIASSTKDEDTEFSTIRQGTSTNALTKLRATETNGLDIDRITGNATITNGNFILTIPNYAELKGLKTSTYQLLDAITIALTENGAKSPTVTIPLDEYMKRRGLKDRKEAKNKVKADLEILRFASMSWEEKKGKNTESYSFVNIADQGEVKKNGDIVFTFGMTFYKILLNYAVMPYPKQLQTINSNVNPNSYYLLRKIAEHKNMNIGKKNENIISVKTLLSVAPFIPSYEEVMNQDRHIDRRIIDSFERDMNALQDTLKWNYCHSNNEALTEEELSNINYETFIDLLVFIEWNSYPDQTARLEHKEEAIAKAKQNKKSSTKKKNDDE